MAGTIGRGGVVAVPDDVAEAMAMAGDRVGRLGCHARWFAEVGSTNDEAIALANRGAEEGWLVGADSQSAGRGRHGRSWSSPPGAGLYLSVVLRPPSHAASLLTLAAGVGVAEGIQAATGAEPRLKWPNDIYLVSSGPRKVAGILAEGGTSGARVDYVVVGIGINVRQAILPPEVAARATSLEDELGRPISRGAVAAAVCAGIWRQYQKLIAEGGEDIVAAWRTRAVGTFGRAVEWDSGGVTCRGVARDVDSDGALVVETELGSTRVVAGEVRWTP